MTRAFERAYRTRFSFLMPDKPLVVEAVSVEAIGARPPRTRPPAGPTPPGTRTATGADCRPTRP